MFKCFKCDSDSPLFRENEKGVPGVWACKEHRTREVDDELDEIVDLLEQADAT